MVGPPSVDLLAVMEQAPLLCSAVAEAVLRTALAPLEDSVDVSEPMLQHAGNTCVGSGIAVAFLAEVTARACAAGQQAPGGSSSSSASSSSAAGGGAAGLDDGTLLQQLARTLLTCFKFIQRTALNGPAAAKLQLYVNRCVLFEDASSAIHRVLGDAAHSRVHVHLASERTADMSAAAGAPRSTEQQLLALHLLGRSLIAA